MKIENTLPDHQKQIAILVFANSSQEELKHKHLVHGQQLFDHLNKKTLVEVRKTGLPYAIYSEKEQHGTTFGERFANAIEDLFEKGYQKVITIGNDSPNLTASHLIDTSHKLMHNTMVVGPSIDGGIYLLGLDKSNFEKNSFVQLPWQTRLLAKFLIKKISASGTHIKLLYRLKDIDKLQDLQYFLNRINRTTRLFKSILLLLFSCIYEAIIYQPKPLVTTIHTIPFNKGSPDLMLYTQSN
ncbi:TIGR04282 family arsenosugar biosynthesis glycosyltransferase [Aquimarina aquimarini]|uniref:TIGR04282 family arsenosugar biosynthesis glycosyltransferase n=1 Tax=Aquimarina aquimarini TaxID=1191734 RepID=UPI000D559B43|nr:DUF2064 domain-containing protein [Aquimarina aquimarini]